MNTSEAKRILSCYRPQGQDARNSDFAAAVALARSNPELARWFADQQAFDAVLTRALGSVPAPLGLKQSILTHARPAPPAKVIGPPWWHWRAPIPISAVAATFLLLAAITALWLYERTDQFADFRGELVQLGSIAEPPVELRTSDLLQIRAWLNGCGANGDFALPRGLKDLKPVGCAALDWRGTKVAFVCFGSGPQFYQLFVVDRDALQNPPSEDQPIFEECGLWNTASWSHHGKIYLFSGMNNLMFVKRIREAGQWHWSS